MAGALWVHVAASCWLAVVPTSFLFSTPLFEPPLEWIRQDDQLRLLAALACGLLIASCSRAIAHRKAQQRFAAREFLVDEAPPKEQPTVRQALASRSAGDGLWYALHAVTVAFLGLFLLSAFWVLPKLEVVLAPRDAFLWSVGGPAALLFLVGPAALV